MPRTMIEAKPRKSLADLEPPARQRRPESLTSREQQIIELIWAGFKNKEIGHRLNISVKTVEAHRSYNEEVAGFKYRTAPERSYSKRYPEDSPIRLTLSADK